MGCGESIKDFFTLVFWGSILGVLVFCYLRRHHKTRLQNRKCLGVKPMHNYKDPSIFGTPPLIGLPVYPSVIEV